MLTIRPPGNYLGFLKITDQPAFTEPILGASIVSPQINPFMLSVQAGDTEAQRHGGHLPSSGRVTTENSACTLVLCHPQDRQGWGGGSAQGAAAHLSCSVTGCLSLLHGREWAVEEEDAGSRPTRLKPPGQGPGGHRAAADFAGEWHTGTGGAGAGVHSG